jgi:hypothetical protein
MKKNGIIVFGIGFLITLLTTLGFTTREKVVDMGNLSISADKNHSLEWSPFIGLSIMAVGGAFYLFGNKNK